MNKKSTELNIDHIVLGIDYVLKTQNKSSNLGKTSEINDNKSKQNATAAITIPITNQENLVKSDAPNISGISIPNATAAIPKPITNQKNIVKSEAPNISGKSKPNAMASIPKPIINQRNILKSEASNISGNTKPNPTVSILPPNQIKIEPNRQSSILTDATHIPNRLNYNYSMVIESLKKISSNNAIFNDQLENTTNNHLMQFDAESLLIIDLLEMAYNERQQFLKNAAKNVGLLVFNNITNEWITNSQLINLDADKYPEIFDFVKQQNTDKNDVKPSDSPVKIYKHFTTHELLFNANVKCDPIFKNVEQPMENNNTTAPKSGKKRVRGKKNHKNTHQENENEKSDRSTSAAENCNQTESLNDKILRIKSKIEMRLNAVQEQQNQIQSSSIEISNEDDVIDSKDCSTELNKPQDIEKIELYNSSSMEHETSSIADDIKVEDEVCLVKQTDGVISETKVVDELLAEQTDRISIETKVEDEKCLAEEMDKIPFDTIKDEECAIKQTDGIAVDTNIKEEECLVETDGIIVDTKVVDQFLTDLTDKVVDEKCVTKQTDKITVNTKNKDEICLNDQTDEIAVDTKVKDEECLVGQTDEDEFNLSDNLERNLQIFQQKFNESNCNDTNNETSEKLSNSGNAVKPNQLCLMIAKLLTLNDDERQKDYIIKYAIDKKLLQCSSLPSTLNDNNTLIISFCWTEQMQIISPILNTTHHLIEKFNKTSAQYFNSMLYNLALANNVDNNINNIPYKSLPYANFDDALNLQEIEKFAVSLVKHNYGKIIENEIRINDNDCREGFIKNGTDQDVYINSVILRQCAMHGDIVKVFAFNKKKTINEYRNVDGFVVNISKRINNRLVIGRFLRKHEDCWIIKLKTGRIPCVKIEKHELEKFQKKSNDIRIDTNTLYLIKIIEWRLEMAYGTIIESIGESGTLEAENKSILAQLGMQQNIFTESILNSIPNESFTIPEHEYKNRENLTKQCIFTIDPETAKDLDDALSLKVLTNGNYEIGVHISDVTYFIAENSELDDVIKQQATSIYMIDRVYHMLPKSLCMICSLLPGHDKLTCSVFWEMTIDGRIVNTRFGKTIINSCAQLSYAHAQNIIDICQQNPRDGFPIIHNSFRYSEIFESITKLHKIATILREKRFENGALQINMPKVEFQLDKETGHPIGISTSKIGQSNYMIEEFMILANITVAKYIYDEYPEISLLRKHKGPDKYMINDLCELLKKCGYQMNFSTSKTIAESMNQIITSSSNSDATKIALSNILAKPMVRADYFCSGNVESTLDFHHYALSIPIYTHFTSPIRRYADVLVHRLFNATIGYSQPPKHSVDGLQEMAQNCNVQKYKAKLAGEESSKVYFIDYIKSIKTLSMRAAIFGIAAHYIDCILISTGHKCRIMINEQPNQSTMSLLNEPGNAKITENKKEMLIQLFGEINVEVYVSKNDAIKARIIIPDKL